VHCKVQLACHAPDTDVSNNPAANRAHTTRMSQHARRSISSNCRHKPSLCVCRAPRPQARPLPSVSTAPARDVKQVFVCCSNSV
jgi:hypothetical protein